jgi:hypothetical protein|nr:MAG TPA: Selenoprotein S (SelS) [Caudoviricetes sp.]DAK49067.1 MAG TPA: Selenoprotein S (SelS) [Caudoviricetes sp.]DAP70525.1 MAG TPA: Selenoprotein S (SelS) [Caudoviricetes sp.]
MILILLKKYWRYIAIIAAVIGLVFWWDGSVKKAYQKGRDDMALEISNRLKEEAIKKAQEQRAQSEKYQDQKAEREEKERIRYVEVQKIVERPIYRNVCIDSDGLSVINAAIADGN